MWDRGALVLSALLSVATANASVIYQSATMGTTGQSFGAAIYSQWLGSRFSLTSNQTITSIGGHLFISYGTIWGAIIKLPGPLSLPLFDAADIESNALAFALFQSSSQQGVQPSELIMESVNVNLGKGDYALVFGGWSGTGLFGSTGFGGMPTGQTDLPGSSYFFAINDGVFVGWCIC